MNQLLPALRIFLALTLLTGVIYPFAVTGVAQALFSKQANGSIVERDGKAVGSILIAQKFEGDRYFKPRPSAGDFNPLPSGGTNLAPTSKKLKEAADAAKTKLGVDAPQDLIYASASGLDPHITPEATKFQFEKVASARGFNESQRIALTSLIDRHTEKRQFGFLGEERVNVLLLNMDIDRL